MKFWTSFEFERKDDHLEFFGSCMVIFQVFHSFSKVGPTVENEWKTELGMKNIVFYHDI